jgi:hypothetical protein
VRASGIHAHVERTHALPAAAKQGRTNALQELDAEKEVIWKPASSKLSFASVCSINVQDAEVEHTEPIRADRPSRRRPN